MGFDIQDIAAFEAKFIECALPVLTAGLPECVSKADRDWHTNTSFSAQRSGWTSHLRVGVKPGDPLADVAFALGFDAFQQELAVELHKADIVVTFDTEPGGLESGGTAALRPTDTHGRLGNPR